LEKRTLITSALPYANGFIHLGHCAGAYLPADIYARYKRLKGEEILYVCGSDEHGVAITIAADKEKVTPKDIIDKYHNANKSAFERFGMSFDIYSRTSNPNHESTAKEFFKDFLDKGFLEEKEEEQFYDEKAQMFLPDRYVEGICPNCGADRARGDQCDSCGAYYDQLELKSPKSLVSGETPIVKKTTHWFMKFNEFQGFLEDYIGGKSKEWKDNVLQQSKSWLKQGLKERAITRDLSWGIHIDDIEGIDKEKAKGKALYVWFDAVLGYITATKEIYKDLATQGKSLSDDWKKWWKSQDSRYIAFIGKDNIVFHTIIFPAMLHARGEGYILPDNVPANEFLNLEGQKISKSRNWSIDLKDFIEDFKEDNYIDALRYSLAMNFPETKDSDFTWKDYQARNNNELSAILGNYVNRVLQFLFKNFEGKVPVLNGKYKDYPTEWLRISEELKSEKIVADIQSEVLNLNDIELINSLNKGLNAVSDNYERFRFRDAITETMNIARAANKYFNDEQPWKSAKSDMYECGKTIYTCVQLVNTLAVLFAPLLPYTSKKIFAFLDKESYTGEALQGFASNVNYWNEAIKPSIEQDRQLKEPSLLFARIEDDLINAQIDKLGIKNEAASEEAVKLITYDDFQKIQLKTAKIIAAEKVKKSKKLLKLQIEIGKEQRQIIAGVAEYYEPEYLIGKVVVVVANLQPAKLMGQESQGMMLAASNEEGKLCFVTPEKEDIGSGAEVR
jgi:methionyl-tRNA synthetase